MTEEFDPKVYLQQGAWRDVRLGLHRTEELLERLGCPQDRLRIVHVAGTTGKGSTCAFTAGILQAAGYKVGLFTSPYVLRFNERIQVNREDISDEDLLAVALEVREVAEQMDEQPTAFELITAAALLHGCGARGGLGRQARLHECRRARGVRHYLDCARSHARAWRYHRQNRARKSRHHQSRHSRGELQAETRSRGRYYAARP